MTLGASSASRPPTTAPRAPRSTGRTSRTRRSRSSSCPRRADEMAGADREDDERTPWLVVEVDGVVRGVRLRRPGTATAPAYDWTVETTVYVDRDFAGRGLGRAAMTALLAVLRLQGFHLARRRDHAAQPGVHGAPPVAGLRAHRRVRGHRLEGRARGTAWSGTASSSDRETGRRSPIRPLADAIADWERAAGLGGGRDRARSAASACGNQRNAGGSRARQNPHAVVEPGVDRRARAAPRRGRTRRASPAAAGRSTGRAASRTRRLRDGAQDRGGGARRGRPARSRPGPTTTAGASGGCRIDGARSRAVGVGWTGPSGASIDGDVRVERLDVRAAAGRRARRTGGRSARVSA